MLYMSDFSTDPILNEVLIKPSYVLFFRKVQFSCCIWSTGQKNADCHGGSLSPGGGGGVYS